MTHASVDRMKATLNSCCTKSFLRPPRPPPCPLLAYSCLSRQKTTQPLETTTPGMYKTATVEVPCMLTWDWFEYGILLVPVQQYQMYQQTHRYCYVYLVKQRVQLSSDHPIFSASIIQVKVSRYRRYVLYPLQLVHPQIFCLPGSFSLCHQSSRALWILTSSPPIFLIKSWSSVSDRLAGQAPRYCKRARGRGERGGDRGEG